MALSPFRALAAVHLQSTWNQMRRQMGSLWVLLLVIVTLGFLSAAPVIAALGVAGYWVGASLAQGRPELIIALAAVAFTLLTLFGGLLGGISGGSRQLPWELLRVFPVRNATLFGGELFAGAGEALTLVELLCLGAACLGASVGAPLATPFFLVLFLTHGVALLCLQQLIGSIAQRLSRRLRTVLLFLPLAAIALPSIVPLIVKQTTRASVESWTQWLDTSTRWLPARAMLEAAQSVAGAEPSGSVLALALLWPLALMGLIAAIAYQLVSRERPLTQDSSSGRPAKLWSFTSQVWGVARLQWESLSQSLPGRFGLLMPLVTLVLIRGPMAPVIPGRAWTVPIAFFYTALAGTNLLFNQFGLDRHGVKVLLLLPLKPEALLQGKLLGFAAWHGLQAAILLALLALSGHGDILELMAGLWLYACLFLMLAMVGQFTSIWQPLPLKKNGLRASQPPLVVVLLMLGTLGSAGALLFGVSFGVHRWLPGWEPVVLGAAFALLLALLFPVMAFNALFLERNREKLAEILGSSG